MKKSLDSLPRGRMPLRSWSARPKPLRALIRESRPEQLVFIGCGSPYYLSRTAASVARELTGLLAEAHPGFDAGRSPGKASTRSGARWPS